MSIKLIQIEVIVKDDDARGDELDLVMKRLQDAFDPSEFNLNSVILNVKAWDKWTGSESALTYGSQPLGWS